MDILNQNFKKINSFYHNCGSLEVLHNHLNRTSRTAELKDDHIRSDWQGQEGEKSSSSTQTL